MRKRETKWFFDLKFLGRKRRGGAMLGGVPKGGKIRKRNPLVKGARRPNIRDAKKREKKKKEGKNTMPAKTLEAAKAKSEDRKKEKKKKGLERYIRGHVPQTPDTRNSRRQQRSGPARNAGGKWKQTYNQRKGKKKRSAGTAANRPKEKGLEGEVSKERDQYLKCQGNSI